MAASKTKTKNEEKYYEYLFLMFAFIVFIDRLAKTFLQDGCLLQFCIKKVTNTGAAFGIMPGMTWFFIAVALTVLILILLFINEANKLGRIALVLIASGTVANLIDRVFFSYVIDLFSVFNSSAFNMADISNCIGGILLVISLLKKK
jgi:lipoprotein signal peptidase